MPSIYTNDLLAQKSQIQHDIQILEKSLSEKKTLLVFLENLIRKAENRDMENSETGITISPILSIKSIPDDDVKGRILDYIKLDLKQCARASEITKALMMNTDKLLQKKVSNALTQLCKEKKLAVVVETDENGIVRERNRLYQLTQI